MKFRISLSIFAALALATAGNAFGQLSTGGGVGGSTTPSPFQVRYFSNLSFADSYINITNDGLLLDLVPTNESATLKGNVGNMCVNVYTFDANEEMVSCCTCPITPNGLKSLSVKNDLVSNTLTPGVPLAVVVKLVATTPVINVDSTGLVYNVSSTCDATLVPSDFLNAPQPTANGSFDQVAYAMHAWASTPHLNTANSQYSLPETEFSQALLGNQEEHNLASTCNFINTVGSGFGICKSCLVRGLGAAQQ